MLLNRLDQVIAVVHSGHRLDTVVGQQPLHPLPQQDGVLRDDHAHVYSPGVRYSSPRTRQVRSDDGGAAGWADDGNGAVYGRSPVGEARKATTRS